MLFRNYGTTELFQSFVVLCGIDFVTLHKEDTSHICPVILKPGNVTARVSLFIEATILDEQSDGDTFQSRFFNKLHRWRTGKGPLGHAKKQSIRASQTCLDWFDFDG